MVPTWFSTFVFSTVQAKIQNEIKNRDLYVWGSWLTHLHVLGAEASEGTQHVVFLVALQRFVHLFLQVRLPPPEQFF